MNKTKFIKTIIKTMLKKKLDYNLPDSALEISDLDVKLGINGAKMHLDISIDMPYEDILKLCYKK